MLTKTVSKCPTGIAYFSTSLKTPESRRLGNSFRLGACSTPLEKYVFAATHKHPMSVLPEPDVMGYDGGNATACHDQLVAFLQQTLLSMETTYRGHSHLR